MPHQQHLPTKNELTALLQYLTSQERDELLQLLTAPLWRPIPNSPQEMAYLSQADELFYGGAAGGGKTDLLLGLAATAHRHSVIFRREFPRVRAIIERSRQILNPGRRAKGRDSYNEALHLWRLAGDRIIEFGSIQHEKNREDQRGRARDFYGFDEITEFTEGIYRFVTAWNRTTIPGQRTRIVVTGNPPTHASGMWVKKYWGPWLNPASKVKAKPGELVWFARIDDKDTVVDGPEPFVWRGDTVKPRSRTFIPAFLSDNPYLKDSGYEAILQSLPEPLRSQMLKGDFAAGIEDDAWQIIPTEWVQLAMQRRPRSGPYQPRPVERQTAIGVDVARGGDDDTVVALLHGYVFAPLICVPGKRTLSGGDVAGLVFASRADNSRVGVDVIGVGSSATDVIREAIGEQALAVNFGAKDEGRDRSGALRYSNVRAACYWMFREALDPERGAGLVLPDDDELLADLTSARWRPVGGAIQVEDKDEIKARLGRSPDRADAVVIAWYAAQWQPPASERAVSAGIRRSNVIG